mgnify:CR=1 FL=1|jgi:hypothetical protein
MEPERFSREEAVEIFDKTIEDAAWGITKELWPSLLGAIEVLVPESKFSRSSQDAE